jgi:hypothetical protein
VLSRFAGFSRLSHSWKPRYTERAWPAFSAIALICFSSRLVNAIRSIEDFTLVSTGSFPGLSRQQAAYYLIGLRVLDAELRDHARTSQRDSAAYADDEIRLAVQRAVALETSRGWRIAKEKASHKIDVVVALAQAALGAVQQGQVHQQFEYTSAASRHGWAYSSAGGVSVRATPAMGAMGARMRRRAQPGCGGAGGRAIRAIATNGSAAALPTAAEIRAAPTGHHNLIPLAIPKWTKPHRIRPLLATATFLEGVDQVIMVVSM